MSKEIEEAKKAYEKLGEKINELEAKEKAEAEGPWEPPLGPFFLYSDGSVGSGYPTCDERRQHGTCFKTYKAGEDASKAHRFFNRLIQLAMHVNPSGKAGGRYIVWYDIYAEKWNRSEWSLISACGRLFENRESAEEACRIMNRDGWKLPY
jgi:hypothetical protein